MKIPVLYQMEYFFRKCVRDPIRCCIMRKKLSKYKYFHVMHCDVIHTENIMNFIQKNFDRNEHCFVFPYLSSEKQKKIKDFSNVYHSSLSVIPLKHAKKIILHGLFARPIINFLYKHKKYLQKSYWFIYGGDLYCTDDNKARYVKQNVRGILTAFDYDVYKEKYGPKKCYDVTYPHDIQGPLPHIKWKKRPDAPINILINNCADNTTYEMYNVLSKFKNKNIKVYTIFSYRAANQAVNRLTLMSAGYKTFGSKFYPILNFMDSNKYNKFLSTIDIYISNQNRQQGNGNATFICSTGGKVFIKKSVSVYKKYNSLGICYFDTETIKKLSFAKFIEYPLEIKKRTIRLLRRRMADSTKVKQWKDFFND